MNKRPNLDWFFQIIPCKTGPSESSAKVRRDAEQCRGKGAEVRTNGHAGKCRAAEEPGSTYK
jgi:hypothetical protein